MTRNEYIDLFHNAQVNLVAFKQVFHCNEELRKMVEMAVAAEREACAKICEEEQEEWGWDSNVMSAAEAIRARSNT